jgi:hypothetical protein
MSVHSLTPGETILVVEDETEAWSLAMACCACTLTGLGGGTPQGLPEGSHTSRAHPIGGQVAQETRAIRPCLTDRVVAKESTTAR